MNAHAHDLTREATARLQDECDELRERVRQLEEALTPTILLPRAWRLTRMEGRMLRLLRAGGGNVVHHERAMIALYGMWDEAPQQKILDVLICKCRRKLMEAQARITIETIWGRGWRLTLPSIDAFDIAVAAEQRFVPWPSPLIHQEANR